MATRDKRVEAMRRNSRNVCFAELQTVLEDYGFVGTPGMGDHWIFRHPGLRLNLSVDPRGLSCCPCTCGTPSRPSTPYRK